MMFVDFVIATSVPFLIQYYIWSAVYANNEITTLYHFKLEDMYIYFVAALCLNRLNNTYDLINNIADQIRNGKIEVFLIKPASYLKLNLLLFLGESSLYYVPPLILALYMALNTGAYHAAIGFIIFAIAGQLLCFAIGILMAFAAFWVVRPNMLLSLQVVFFGVLGGTLMPVSFWPEYLAPIMRFNPFRIIIGGPAEYLVRPTTALFWELSMLFVIWATLIVIAQRITFNAGLKKYNSVGG